MAKLAAVIDLEAIGRGTPTDLVTVCPALIVFLADDDELVARRSVVAAHNLYRSTFAVVTSIPPNHATLLSSQVTRNKKPFFKKIVSSY
jgi:hypothetical protein